MRLWKFLNEDGTPYHGGSGRWFLPKDGQPGDWMPPISGKLVPCENGYHACRDRDLRSWLGPALYELEARCEVRQTPSVVVCRQARLLRRVETWNERTQRLFACDCAERTLPVYEVQYPEEDWPRYAIEVARRYAWGTATRDELVAAARMATEALSRVTWPSKAAVYALWTATQAAVPVTRMSAWAAFGALANADAVLASSLAANTPVAFSMESESRWQTERLLWYLEGALA